MAGLYPDDKIINMFGTDVKYPGLDPVTQKFSDGDFSNPLIKPSYIPAETFNLILDNIEGLIRGLGFSPNNKDKDQLFRAIADSRFPIGTFYRQGPDEDEPKERGLPGNWEQWSYRAIQYEIIPAASYPTGTISKYVQGSNISANTYCIYDPVDSDRQILKSKNAITSTGSQPNPIEWDVLSDIASGVIRVGRKKTHALTEDDYIVGDTIQYNGQDYRVIGVLNWAGKFSAIEGLNRRTFNGGIQKDAVREIWGKTYAVDSELGRPMTASEFGVFDISTTELNSIFTIGNNIKAAWWFFYNNRLLLTASEHIVRNLPIRIWRRYI